MMTTPRKKLLSHAVRAGFALSVISAVLAVPNIAQAAQTCGSSSAHTICVSISGPTLTGRVQVTITNSPNNGEVFYTWAPPGPSVFLMEQDGPSPDSGDYSFTWPTEKYRDAIGSLQIRALSKTARAGGRERAHALQRQHERHPAHPQQLAELPSRNLVPAHRRHESRRRGRRPRRPRNIEERGKLRQCRQPPLFFLGDISKKGSSPRTSTTTACLPWTFRVEGRCRGACRGRHPAHAGQP